MFPKITAKSGWHLCASHRNAFHWLQRLYGLWLVVFLGLCVPWMGVQAAEVTLAWDANTESNLGGYRLHYGQQSGNYSANVDVGNQTSYTLSGLEDDATYYFAVTAYDINDTIETVFSNEVSKSFVSPPPPGGDLPAPWLSADIGNVGQGGGAGYANGTFTIQGSGSDIWGSADAFHYVYRPLSGGGTIVARVTSIEDTHSWAKAGVMIRERLNSNARHAMVAMTPGHGSTFQRRLVSGDRSYSTTDASVSVPYWVKLERAGDTFRAYQSANGTNWSSIGSVTLAMASDVYVGLALTAHNNNTLNTATLADVKVTSGGTAPSTVPYTFTTEPSGLNLSYGGVERTTPFTVEAEIGSQKSISAPDTQQGLTFNSWSDDGAATHTITIGDSAQTLTATYVVPATAPVADFSASPISGTAPLAVTFSDASAGDVNDWSWSFGDGGGSGKRNPTYTYANEGTYAVSLTVSGPGGSDTLTKTDYVTVSAGTEDDPGNGRVTQGQQVLYGFNEGDGTTVRDLSGVGEALDLTITEPDAVSWLPGGGLAVNSATVIRTAGAATKVNQALKASQALTLEAWVVPRNTSQDGPSRIVTLSKNGYPDGGNFMLGQEGSAYEMRLRTNQTDQYGKPALSTPSASTALTHVVYTRDTAGMERLYVDGVEQASGVKSGNFSNWGDYALALANEPVKERRWLGELHLVAIYDRALKASEVERNFNAGPDLEPAITRVNDGQLVLYGFNEGDGTTVRDLSGVGEALDLTITEPDAVSWLPGGGLAVNSATVIRTAGAATKVNQALKASQALTLEAWVVPRNTSQDGPSRIVTLSKNGYPDGGNFMLGQEGSAYEMRLRTNQTDQYGKPALSTPSASTALTHVVYTRDTAGMERLYVDGVEQASGVKSGNFSNWGDYALALANEPVKERRWLGELHLVAIYDRALKASEVERNFNAGPQGS